jgi:oxygen-independent coproporphyrinogen III oxidase
LRDAGIRRISIGVQTFEAAESRALGRAQKTVWVETALERIRAHGFPILNIDLMYGIEGQTSATLARSIEGALSFAPEEMYLYPLYVRPLTGIARQGARAQDDRRLELYRAGRDILVAGGYEQVSMRFFRRTGAPASADTCCQDDGTVGIGCGARSYTRDLHYASEWAVGARPVREILDGYVRAPAEAFDVAAYGARVSLDDQRRRYVIKTLLRRAGVPLAEYRARFGSRAEDDLPELADLVEEGLAVNADTAVRLTDRGMELSDAIGPWLYSAATRASMAAYGLR